MRSFASLGCLLALLTATADTARSAPPGVAVIARLKADSGPVSLTPRSSGDEVDVVVAGPHPVGFQPNAFGYGESHDRGDRCLLVSLHTPAPGQTSWMLCGKSPVLVLQPDTDRDALSAPLTYLPHGAALRRLPANIRQSILGGALILQTEGGDSVLYMTKAGPAWKELSGGE